MQFHADTVTFNQGGYTLNRLYLDNVAVDNNLVFKAVTPDIIATAQAAIANDLNHAISQGFITSSDTNTGFTVNVDFTNTAIPLSKEDRFRQMLKQQMAPAIINHRGDKPRAVGNSGADFSKVQQNEIVALHLLRSMVAPDVFKKYLKHGFVTVQGPSGLVYQIQRKSHLIKVWNKGVLLCTLCVYIKDQSIPPTDEVVSKMLICELEEIDIWRRANINWRAAYQQFGQVSKKTIEEKHLQEMLLASYDKSHNKYSGGMYLAA